MAVCEIFMRTFCVFFCFCAVFSCVLFHNVIGCSPQKMEKKTLLAAPKNRPVFGPNNGLKSLKPPCLCLFCFGPFSGAVFRTDFWGPHGTICMRRSQTRIDPMCDCIVWWGMHVWLIFGINLGNRDNGVHTFTWWMAHSLGVEREFGPCMHEMMDVHSWSRHWRKWFRGRIFKVMYIPYALRAVECSKCVCVWIVCAWFGDPSSRRMHVSLVCIWIMHTWNV